MKRILIASLFLTMVFDLTAQQNPLEFGLKSGFNLSILSASVNSESSARPGFHFGAYLKTKGGFRPEIYFSSQGQKDNYMAPPSFVSTGKTTTTINYLNIPLLMEFGKKKVTFQVGPQIGFVLSGKEKGTIDGQPVNDDLKDNLKSPEISAVLGMGINVSTRVNLGIRYNLGLTEIFDSSQTDFPSVKNRVAHFYLAVRINK